MQQLFEYVEDRWVEQKKEWSVYQQHVRTNNGVEGKSVPLMHQYIHHNTLTELFDYCFFYLVRLFNSQKLIGGVVFLFDVHILRCLYIYSE